MVRSIRELFNKRIRNFFRKRFRKIIEINQKYAHSSIKMTPAVSFALLMLRFYLIFLVIILIYKFITLAG
jgi:hypothetical protein